MHKLIFILMMISMMLFKWNYKIKSNIKCEFYFESYVFYFKCKCGFHFILKVLSRWLPTVSWKVKNGKFQPQKVLMSISEKDESKAMGRITFREWNSVNGKVFYILLWQLWRLKMAENYDLVKLSTDFFLNLPIHYLEVKKCFNV